VKQPGTILGRLAGGVGANLAGQLIIAAQNVVLLPLFLNSWGVKLYGDWLALSAAAAYLALMDMGMQNYAVNLLNIHRTNNHQDEYHEVLHSALLLYLVLIASGLTLASLLAWAAPWHNMFGLKILGQTTAGILFVFISLQVLLSIPVGAIVGIYRSFGEYGRGQNISNLVRVLGIGIVCFALLARGGPVLVAVLMATQPLLLWGVVSWDLGRRHDEVRIGISRASWQRARSLVGPSMFFMLFPISNGLAFQGTSLILAASAGSTALVVFSTTRTLANLIRQVFSMINSALWPEVTSLYAANRLPQLCSLAEVAARYAVAASLAGASFLYFFGDRIFLLWTMQKVRGDQTLLGILLLSSVSNSLWYTCGTIQAAVNHHKEMAIRSLASAMTTILLSVVLVRPWGARGVALAILLGELPFYSYALMRTTCRVLEMPTTGLLKSLALHCGPFGICAFLLSWAMSRAVGYSWSGLATAGLVCALSMAAFAWVLVLDRPQRRTMLTWAVGAWLSTSGRARVS
jgi:O-antigen/teichoic acid export membrane protein